MEGRGAKSRSRRLISPRLESFDLEFALSHTSAGESQAQRIARKLKHYCRPLKPRACRPFGGSSALKQLFPPPPSYDDPHHYDTTSLLDGTNDDVRSVLLKSLGEGAAKRRGERVSSNAEREKEEMH